MATAVGSWLIILLIKGAEKRKFTFVVMHREELEGYFAPVAQYG